MSRSPEWLGHSLEPMILQILRQERSYGYVIQKRLSELAGSPVQISTLYRSLHRLEAARLIRSRWDRSTVPARKWYEVTAAGRRKLAQQATHWRQQARMILELFGPDEPGTGMEIEPA